MNKATQNSLAAVRRLDEEGLTALLEGPYQPGHTHRDSQCPDYTGAGLVVCRAGVEEFLGCSGAMSLQHKSTQQCSKSLNQKLPNLLNYHRGVAGAAGEGAGASGFTAAILRPGLAGGRIPVQFPRLLRQSRAISCTERALPVWRKEAIHGNSPERSCPAV